MGKTLATRAHIWQKRWQEPAWYHALSLTERIALRQTSPHSISLVSTQDQENAARQLRAWKAQNPFDQETLFAERLIMDAITEEELFALLAESVTEVQSRTSSVPDWLVALAETFEDHFVADEIAWLPQEIAAKHPIMFCLQALSPLVKRGLDRINRKIQALSSYSHLPFDPQQITQTLLANLPQRLLEQSAKTFVLEMHVARIQQHLHGETPEERFEDFVRQLEREGKILTLLEEYPVLARQLVITIDHWADYACEFLGHLCADWQDICALFTPGDNPGMLIKVQDNVGDLHRHGRSVQILKFHSGLQLLYKPRSLAIDGHFQELLTWLNARGTQPAFRTLKIIDRKTYGWSEFVYAHDCASADEVACFYERQGNYLALLYVLNATDLHSENLIADGEHPVIVDLETLFQPHLHEEAAVLPDYFALQAISRSVLGVGLLPFWFWSNEETAGVDISGLGGQPGQWIPRPVPMWQEEGTDQMRLAQQRVEMPGSANRPRLHDQDVNVLDYSKHIVVGFTRTYRLLYTWRETLMADVLPRFAHDEIRLILRPTAAYKTLLIESFHPNMLRDALVRDRFLDHLWMGVAQQPDLSSVISAERQDLLRGDIPLFTTHPDSRVAWTSDGVPLPDFLAESSLDQVRQHLQLLGEGDLARQAWIIEASLATLLQGSEHMTGKTFQSQSAQCMMETVSRDRLLTVARHIGARLDELALHQHSYTSWLGIGLIHENTWGLYPTGTDLYDGASGIALFLGYLGALTGEERFTKLAQSALAFVLAQIEQQKKYFTNQNMGVFDGLSSVIYTLTHLGVLWNRKALLQEATGLVELLSPLIAQDAYLDIISGSAGCILCLLGLYSVYPVPGTLAVAIRCGDRLLATAQTMAEGVGWKTFGQERPLGGFAHGTAGIALSLFALAHVSKEERFYQTAQAALAYDRSLFLPQRQNWADLRTFPPDLSQMTNQNIQTAADRPTCMVAWCHGAAGIGLSRLDTLKYKDDSTMRREIAIALKTTTDTGVIGNHSLCHGALGNIETLLTATHVLNDPMYSEMLEGMIASIMKSIDTEGWATGVPRGVETPGLMTGLAGIGYELLRLAEPAKVPSVLLVAPPQLCT